MEKGIGPMNKTTIINDTNERGIGPMNKTTIINDTNSFFNSFTDMFFSEVLPVLLLSVSSKAI